MDIILRFRQLAIKRGLRPGALLDSAPQDLDILLVAMRKCIKAGVFQSETEINQSLKDWLLTAGAMMDIDHVELRRWLVDLHILRRDAYGKVYELAPLPGRLVAIDTAMAGADVLHEYRAANEHESRRRALRKAAWQQQN